jgi:hypothetical protein
LRQIVNYFSEWAFFIHRNFLKIKKLPVQNDKVQDEQIMSAVPPELLTHSLSLVRKWKGAPFHLETLLSHAQPTAHLLRKCNHILLFSVQIAAGKVLFASIHSARFSLSLTHWKR